MGAMFCNNTVFDDQDLICISDCGQAMCYCYRRAILRQLFQALLDVLLTFII